MKKVCMLNKNIQKINTAFYITIHKAHFIPFKHAHAFTRALTVNKQSISTPRLGQIPLKETSLKILECVI